MTITHLNKMSPFSNKTYHQLFDGIPCNNPDHNDTIIHIVISFKNNKIVYKTKSNYICKWLSLVITAISLQEAIIF